MPTPTKRSGRGAARRELRTDAIVEDSSPSRPSKRRKKSDDDAPVPVEQPNDLPNEEGDSSLIADPDQSGIDVEDDDLVARVTQHLLMPDTTVQASIKHSNSIHESNKDGVKAYAKIAAQNWTYYITRLNVNIGRSSDPHALTDAGLASIPDEDAKDAVHIDLGPSKMVSRQHAQIFFNRDKETWWLEVLGRNGLKVNGTSWRSNDKGPLESGQVIEIAGIEMMFVLPVELSESHIHKQYLERAGIQHVESPESRPARHPLPSGENYGPQSSPKGRGSRGPGSQKALAPAPPDYKRPGTPPSAVSRSVATLRSPAIDNLTGPMLLGNSDVDLSLDENKHIKPQYSYAQMITQAIMQTPEEKLNLSGIYSFIISRYSYYRHQIPSGWQNSIRHNLSLNKSFEKVARSSDEPGKGMKWQLTAESRDEMIRNAFRGGRGGHRGSSNPSSPSQPLNYITHGPHDMAARDVGSARKRKVSPSGSPQPRSALRDSHLTPVRPSRKPLPDEAGAGTDGSPLPRLPRKANASSALGLVENAPGSPTLTSSYLQEDGASFVTPAPHRVHPKLAPPSTAQRPSQHMPTSSPAPFWKYADIGSTPLKPTPQYDQSPTKAIGGSGAMLPSLPQSSSPPRGIPSRSKSPMPPPSPTRGGSRATVDDTPSPTEAEEGGGGFDLTKGFQSIGSYHAPVSHGKQVQPATNGDPPPPVTPAEEKPPII